jgi:UDP-glucose 4-epimerase
MKILMTGGAGYVGYTLVRRLLEAALPDLEILVYDNLSRQNYAFFCSTDRLPRDAVRFIQGDVLDGRKLEQSLRGVDAVLHLAAKVTTPFADHEAHAFDQVNHWGTAQLAQAIEQSDVGHVIYLSSISVYGGREEIVDEGTDAHPHTFYGISKARGEQQLSRLEDRCKLHIIRSGNVFGFSPTMRFDAVINRFMFDANFKGRITIEGDGGQHRAFIHIDQICDLLVQLLTKDVPAGTYNAVEHDLSIKEVADRVAELYPGLERLAVSQNMPMRSIRVKVPCRILDHVELPSTTIDQELRAFREHFTF